MKAKNPLDIAIERQTMALGGGFLTDLDRFCVDVEDVAQKLGIDVVPVIGEGTLHDAVNFAKQGIRSTWGGFEAEGIVARPKTELNARSGHRLIAKIKCRDFAA